MSNIDELYEKALAAAARPAPGALSKDDFIKMILQNVKTQKWLSGHFDVAGHRVGIKAYGLWVQRMEVNGGPYRDSGMYIKTQKALRTWLEQNLTEL